MHPSDLNKIVGAVREVIVTELKPVKEDIAVLKEDVSVLKKDFSGLQADMTGVKKDIKSLKENVDDLIEITSDMAAKMVTKDELAQVRAEMATKVELEEMRAEMATKTDLAYHYKALTNAIDATRRSAKHDNDTLRAETNRRLLPLERRAGIAK